MKFLHVFTMVILLFISPSKIYSSSHPNFQEIMTFVQDGSKHFRNNDDNSNYTEAIAYYKEALKALGMNKRYGGSRYPIKSSDRGYVYDAIPASYQTTVFEELAYFLNLNIGKSYVGLCRRVQANNKHRESCESAIPYLKKAERLLEKSKYNKKKYTDVVYHLAFSHMLLGAYEEAQKILEKGLRINGHDIEIYVTLGIMYGKYASRDNTNNEIRQLLEKAEEYFRKASDINPERPRDINNLGEIYFRLGLNSSSISKKSKSQQKAKKYYRKAIEYYRKAINYYDEAIFNDPIDSVLYNNRGLAYLALFTEINKEQYTEVCRDFRIAINLNLRNSILNNENYDNLVSEGKCPHIIDKSSEIGLKQDTIEKSSSEESDTMNLKQFLMDYKTK